MIKPPEYIHEKERLQALESYNIMDSLPESDYDNITFIAAQICDTPISLISLVDDKKQWFKSHFGLSISETAKEFSFCAHAINNPDTVLTINDCRLDERFHDNPFVINEPFVVFYSGIPLVTDDGFPVGTLCVIDNKPKTLDEKQNKALRALSNQVLNLLRLRKMNAEMETANIQLQEKNQDLDNFATIAAHDLKVPLISISNMGKLILKLHANAIDADGKEMLELINESSNRLLGLVDAVLNYSRCDSLLKENKTPINAEELKNEIFSFFVVDKDIRIEFLIECKEIVENRGALEQILINLIANAIKYNDKKITEISVKIQERATDYLFIVKDNGSGIAEENFDKIFQIFEIVTKKDRYGEPGNGIGLATVKKLVNRLGGNITVASEIGKGTSFTFNLKK